MLALGGNTLKVISAHSVTNTNLRSPRILRCLIRRISVRVSVFYHEKCLNIFIEEEENFRPILMAFPDSPRYFDQANRFNQVVFSIVCYSTPATNCLIEGLSELLELELQGCCNHLKENHVAPYHGRQSISPLLQN